jgi:hypothetical protein
MAPLTVSIPHSLGRQEAKRRLSSGLERLPAMGTVALDQQAWTGDRMTFTVRAFGFAAPGEIDVDDDAVRLQLELPALLRKFAKPVQDALLERARLLLTKR